ncbi:MAG: sugar transferase [Oscillospiraceae bacterium]|jgi:lipopolysaccharide/colanic/teichoic acid biosynthesis glycosyltransferase|nr:sugar transferase [Oscillospiraceae bacterium]
MAKRKKHRPYGPYEMFFKRPLGFLGALFGIIILSPLLLFTAAIIKLTMGSPVIFKQQRPGLHGKIFTMYKFRSMKDATDRNGRKLTDAERLKIIKEKGEEFVSSDEERMTWFGNFIRKFSIDELPELFNVLKGDMAFIGPRPLAVIYLPYYTEEEMHRHDVRPGLTGLAQVNGRNSISWEEKFKYDLKYVNKITFAGDVKLFFDTIKTVIDHSDIGQGAEKPTALNVERAHMKKRSVKK